MACLPAAMFCKVRNGVSGRGEHEDRGTTIGTQCMHRLFVTFRRCRVTLPPRDEDEGEDEGEDEDDDGEQVALGIVDRVLSELGAQEA